VCVSVCACVRVCVCEGTVAGARTRLNQIDGKVINV
jgi:hypothetical protein